MTDPCIAPQEIQEGDLMAYVDGEADSRIMAHVERCVYCQREAKALETTLVDVTDLSRRPDCPSPETLLLYETKLLAELERAPIHHHVQHCRLCQSDLAELSAVGYTPPAVPWHERLLHQGRLLIELLRQPTPPMAAWGTRGDNARPPQMMEYQAGPYHVTVQSSAEAFEPDGLYVEGWLTQPDATYPLPPVRAILIGDDESQVTDTLDEVGYFSLEQIRPGHYQLHLEFPTHIAVIPDLDLTRA